jgi:hypothetical protein
MRYHTNIGKFMGIWPSKKELIMWVNTQCKPKGNIELKLGSKVFLPLFLPVLRIERGSLKKDPTSSTLLVFIYDIGHRGSHQTRRILQNP